MENRKEKLRQLILAILNKIGKSNKTKLAKLILFSEIEYFKKYEASFTGLYFVRLPNGPVIAFFDEVLSEGEGLCWEKKTDLISIFSELEKKKQFTYSPIKEAIVEGSMDEIVSSVVSTYGSLTATALSERSHELPAWRHSEPNEPIYTAELSIENEAEYFALIDLLDEIDDAEEEDNLPLQKALSPTLS